MGLTLIGRPPWRRVRLHRTSIHHRLYFCMQNESRVFTLTCSMGQRRCPALASCCLMEGRMMPAPHLEVLTREALAWAMRKVTSTPRAVIPRSVLSRPPQHQPQSWRRFKGPSLAPCCCHKLRKPCPAQAGPAALNLTSLNALSVGHLTRMTPACNLAPHMAFHTPCLADTGWLTFTLQQCTTYCIILESHLCGWYPWHLIANQVII